MTDRHPEHDRIAAFIRSGYTQSFPEMGYHVEWRRFGYYQRHDAGFGAVLLEGVEPADVPDLVADARAYYGDVPFSIFTEGEDADATLRPALEATGWIPGPIQIHLAHMGAVPEPRPVPGVTIERIDEAGAEEWTRVKLKGFASSEDEPDPESVRFDVALRRAEMAEEGRFALARTAGGEPAAIIGRYEAAQDTIISLLATRVPYRNRGIARWLLSRAIAEAYACGHRSISISCDPEDTPIRLYRRLGFTDEVHRRRPYDLPVAPG
jgi:GNAT superfamily N-acetyltransferase